MAKELRENIDRPGRLRSGEILNLLLTNEDALPMPTSSSRKGCVSPVRRAVENQTGALITLPSGILQISLCVGIHYSKSTTLRHRVDQIHLSLSRGTLTVDIDSRKKELHADPDLAGLQRGSTRWCELPRDTAPNCNGMLSTVLAQTQVVYDENLSDLLPLVSFLVRPQHL